MRASSFCYANFSQTLYLYLNVCRKTGIKKPCRNTAETNVKYIFMGRNSVPKIVQADLVFVTRK